MLLGLRIRCHHVMRCDTTPHEQPLLVSLGWTHLSIYLSSICVRKRCELEVQYASALGSRLIAPRTRLDDLLDFTGGGHSDKIGLFRNSNNSTPHFRRSGPSFPFFKTREAGRQRGRQALRCCLLQYLTVPGYCISSQNDATLPPLVLDDHRCIDLSIISYLDSTKNHPLVLFSTLPSVYLEEMRKKTCSHPISTAKVRLHLGGASCCLNLTPWFMYSCATKSSPTSCHAGFLNIFCPSTLRLFLPPPPSP